MPKAPSSTRSNEEYMQYYAGSQRKVPEHVKAHIRADPYLQASWRAHYEANMQRKRAEDCYDWPFSIPREIIDIILSQECLSVREHIALAATSPALRRMYHGNDIWNVILHHRTLPVNGQQSLPRQTISCYLPSSKPLFKIATAPQKKKAYGPFFMALVERYSNHNTALKKCFDHRVSPERALKLYPNLTLENLDRLKYLREVPERRYSRGKEAGYAETSVEWMSFRVRAGLT